VSEDPATREHLGGHDRSGDGSVTGLNQLLEHLRTTRGFDFTAYKTSSLTRRIRRRMDAVHCNTFDEYRAYLEHNTDEFSELFNTILINVTSFFRDPETWSRVAEVVIPQIVGEVGSEDPIRVWVAGCATGEEAFTIAILLCEGLGDDAFRRRVKIYTTDVDQEAITEARHGRYPKRKLTEDTPAEFVDRCHRGHRPHGRTRRRDRTGWAAYRRRGAERGARGSSVVTVRRTRRVERQLARLPVASWRALLTSMDQGSAG
jgi:two-component system, chemotaxis family, CheB/CheR fusion protein